MIAVNLHGLQRGNTYLQKFDLTGLEEIIEVIKDHPVYITIDLDVLDLVYFRGLVLQNQEDHYKELLDAIYSFRKLHHIVGCDIVELAPHYDRSRSFNCRCL